jgi:hypothetical protein
VICQENTYVYDDVLMISVRRQLVLVALVLGLAQNWMAARADVVLYATSPATNKIYSADIATNTVNIVINDAHGSGLQSPALRTPREPARPESERNESGTKPGRCTQSERSLGHNRNGQSLA